MRRLRRHFFSEPPASDGQPREAPEANHKPGRHDRENGRQATGGWHQDHGHEQGPHRHHGGQQPGLERTPERWPSPGHLGELRPGTARRPGTRESRIGKHEGCHEQAAGHAVEADQRLCDKQPPHHSQQRADHHQSEIPPPQLGVAKRPPACRRLPRQAVAAIRLSDNRQQTGSQHTPDPCDDRQPFRTRPRGRRHRHRSERRHERDRQRAAGRIARRAPQPAAGQPQQRCRHAARSHGPGDRSAASQRCADQRSQQRPGHPLRRPRQLDRRGRAARASS